MASIGDSAYHKTIMALDFSKIDSKSSDNLVMPSEIFASLHAKSAKFSYLRDVQADVLKKWFDIKDAKDLRLKMNTGGGKTLVGLLILKSCLNQNKLPAVFVAPTQYLATQVIETAASLGLPTDTEPRSPAVLRGKAILVTTIKTLFNGKSKFGIGNTTDLIPIGSLVLDDAHACLAAAEQQFTLTIESSNVVYKKLLDLFSDDLDKQSSSRLLEIKNQEPYATMLVPFWSWFNKLKKVEQILFENKDDEDLKFEWPLLKDHLSGCRCVFGGGKVSISPRCLPIDVVPSFKNAKHRVFMSATFADDGVLITDFDASSKDIENAITPDTASDIGERMILVPQELDPSISEDEILIAIKAKSKNYNVVVIVPSLRRAEDFWKPVAQEILVATNLEEGISNLKKRTCGLTVIVNKYDGVDLPGDLCRILVLDGLPDPRRLIDRIDQTHLAGSSLQMTRSIQQIEQGMGRGVRANDDYCVVVLMGSSLIGHLFGDKGISKFTNATKAQFELSETVCDQIRKKGIREISDAMDACLTRNSEWVKAAKNALVHVKYDSQSSRLDIAAARREAFNAFIQKRYPEAISILQKKINQETEETLKGWLMGELAEYTHPLNQVEAQQILSSARQLNNKLIFPLEGTQYQRINPRTLNQSEYCLKYLKEKFPSGNALLIEANVIEEDLSFKPNSYKKFHSAFKSLAMFIGLNAQLPEEESGKGPDVLWELGEMQYLVIECKNEAVSEKINKHDCNQLAGSFNWFADNYDQTASAKPILIHPSIVFEYAATPHADTRIINKAKLGDLKKEFKNFCIAMAQPTLPNCMEVMSLLEKHHLLGNKIVEVFTVQPQ